MDHSVGHLVNRSGGASGQSIIRWIQSVGHSVVRSTRHTTIRSLGPSFSQSIIFSQQVVHSVGRVIQSIDHSVQSVVHPVSRRFGRSVIRSVCRSFIRSVIQSVGHSGGRSLRYWIGRATGGFDANAVRERWRNLRQTDSHNEIHRRIHHHRRRTRQDPYDAGSSYNEFQTYLRQRVKTYWYSSVVPVDE